MWINASKSYDKDFVKTIVDNGIKIFGCYVEIIAQKKPVDS